MTCSTASLVTQKKDGYCVAVLRDRMFLLSLSFPVFDDSGNPEADRRLCFLYMNSTIPLLPKSKISSLLTSSVAVQPGL